MKTSPRIHKHSFLWLALALLSSLACPAQNPGIDMHSIEARLHRGDLTAVDELRAAHDLSGLYYILHKTDYPDFGVHTVEIKSKVRQTLADIPDHASFMAKRIEELSNDPKGDRKRSQSFFLLGLVRSPEAIAEVGRFLNDDRNPDMQVWRIEGGTPAPRPNSQIAYYWMEHVLGDKSPTKHLVSHNHFQRVAAMKAWWASDASLPYRQPKAVQATPLQTPTVKKVPTPSPTVVGTTSPPQTSDWLLPLLLLIGGGGLIFWVTRGAHRRS